MSIEISQNTLAEVTDCYWLQAMCAYKQSQFEAFLGKQTLAKQFFFRPSTMPREHDRPDPNLIIQGGRRVQPSKRGLGNDYPVTPLEELRERDKSK